MSTVTSWFSKSPVATTPVVQPAATGVVAKTTNMAVSAKATVGKTAEAAKTMIAQSYAKAPAVRAFVASHPKQTAMASCAAVLAGVAYYVMNIYMQEEPSTMCSWTGYGC